MSNNHSDDHSDYAVVFILSHLIAYAYKAAFAGAIIWLAWTLKNGWVLIALMWSGGQFTYDYITPTKRTKRALSDIKAHTTIHNVNPEKDQQ